MTLREIAAHQRIREDQLEGENRLRLCMYAELQASIRNAPHFAREDKREWVARDFYDGFPEPPPPQRRSVEDDIAMWRSMLSAGAAISKSGIAVD